MYYKRLLRVKFFLSRIYILRQMSNLPQFHRFTCSLRSQAEEFIQIQNMEHIQPVVLPLQAQISTSLEENVPHLVL